MGLQQRVGTAAANMTPEERDDKGRAYLPSFLGEAPPIIAATKILESGQSETLRIPAIRDAGTYEFVCTFPGHWRVMRGVLIVADNLDEFLAKNPEAAPKLTEWKITDFTDDLKRVGQHRNFARGQQLFTSLACAGCHQLGKEGVAFGPQLNDVVKKYQGNAQTVLAAADKAMGGDKLKTLQYSATGYVGALGQAYAGNMDDTWPRFELKTFVRTIDYSTMSMKEEQTRVQGPWLATHGGGQRPIIGERRTTQLVSARLQFTLETNPR